MFRSTFSPIFTSGKMKGMYRFMQEIGSRLTDDLQIKAEAATDFELKVIKMDLLLLGSYIRLPDTLKK